MELIIQILMLFIFINCTLKLSFWKFWQAILFGVISAAFIIFTCQYAILQSKTQINDFLQNKNILQDAAVLVTIESALCFAFCFAAMREVYGKAVKLWVKPLYWYPSLLIFPVQFYILTQTIFAMPGTDFTTISYVLAGIAIVAFPLFSYCAKIILPEKDLRLEVHFLVSLFVCILGLITTVNANVTYAAVKEPLNLKAIALSFGLFALTFIIGFVWNKAKWVIQQKKSNKNKRITN